MSEPRSLYRSFEGYALQRAADGQPQSRKAVASTARKDRAGRIVEQKWDLDSFRSNPVLLANHDQGKFPIGRADAYMGRHNGQDALFAELDFDLDQGLGRVAADLWDRGFLRALSVGWTAVAEPYLKFDDDGMADAIIFPENELAEISVVSVPANPDAIAVASALEIERGQLEALFTDLPEELPTAPERTGGPGTGGHVLSRQEARLRLDRARLIGLHR